MKRSGFSFSSILFLIALFLLGNKYMAFSHCDNDRTPPSLRCKTANVWLNENGYASIIVSDVIASLRDNCCNNDELALSVSRSAFSCADLDKGPNHSPTLGQVQVVVTAKDCNNNTARCTTWVNVHFRPSIHLECKSSVVVYLDSDCKAVLDKDMILASYYETGACQIYDDLTFSIDPDTVFGPGLHNVVLTASDLYGYSASCTTQVTALDTISPVFIPKDLEEIEAETGPYDEACGANVAWIPPEVTDNCGDPVVTSTHSPGEFFSVGTTSVIYTATDASGNNSSYEIIVKVWDKASPIIMNCPGDIDVPLGGGSGGACSEHVSWDPPVVTDNCGSEFTSLSYSWGETNPAFSSWSWGEFNPGTTTVTVTATDASGNQSTCDFDVTVVDDSPPVFTFCPGDLYVILGPEDDDCGLVMTWDPPQATDNCGVTSLVPDHWPDSFFDVGVTPVKYTATDAAGNVAICNFNVTVIDTNSPVFTFCPGDLYVYLSPEDDDCGLVMTWPRPQATDNCGVTSLVPDHWPDSFFDLGVTPVKYTATDAAGNVAYCTFNVTVIDTISPVFTYSPPDIVVSTGPCDTDCKKYVTWDEPMVAENCDVQRIERVPDESFFDVTFTIVTYTATDNSGNTATCSFSVTVIDDTPPTIDCPSDVVAYLAKDDPDGMTEVYWEERVMEDNCGIGEVKSSAASGDPFPVGTTEVFYKVMDINDNLATCSFYVTVLDTNHRITEPGNYPQAPVTAGSSFGIDDIAPNPFDQTTKITFTVPDDNNVSLVIYNSSGGIIKELVNGSISPGKHSINWDGSDNIGRSLPSGMYYITLKSGIYITSASLGLVK